MGGHKNRQKNIHSVAGLLPASFAGMYAQPEKWGAPSEGLYFFISPYRRAAETDGMEAATRRYSPLVKQAPDGSIVNYAGLAGRPYPYPRTGLEAAWNYDFNTHGDGCFYNRRGTNLNPASSSERVGDQDAWELYWIHRVDVPPLPDLPGNAKGVSKSTFYHMYSPPEFRNIRMFNLRYIDQRKNDDTYMWLSSFRRIQRMSTTDRTDAIDGTDLIYDDEYGWDGQILRNTYKLAGERELLCGRHVAVDEAERQPGQALLNNITRERTKTLVVEVKSRNPDYLYGRRIWYLDPETCLIAWTEIYDARMRFWKCFENLTADVTTRSGQMKNCIVGAHYVDFQRTHAGIWQNRSIDAGISISQRMFTIQHLQREGH